MWMGAAVLSFGWNTDALGASSKPPDLFGPGFTVHKMRMVILTCKPSAVSSNKKRLHWLNHKEFHYFS